MSNIVVITLFFPFHALNSVHVQLQHEIGSLMLSLDAKALLMFAQFPSFSSQGDVALTSATQGRGVGERVGALPECLAFILLANGPRPALPCQH